MRIIFIILDGHKITEMTLHWLDDSPLEIDSSIELPEHLIESINFVNCTNRYIVGE